MKKINVCFSDEQKHTSEKARYECSIGDLFAELHENISIHCKHNR